MANYILHYKGKYRLLCEIDQNTNDFVRRDDGSIEDIDVYIACQHGNKIFTFGHIDNKRPIWLLAYIPSLIRGRKIVKELKEKNIELIDIRESDEEVEFKFKAADIEIVAEFMKARTSGASISPFSNKNLPRSEVKIPTEKMALYKEITSIIPKGNLLLISKLTNEFLDEILSKSLRNRGQKTYDYRSEMKKLKMSRQVKEYIFAKNMFNEYLDYLKKEIEKIYK